MTTLAERLKLARSKAGLSQSKVAEAVGISQPTYQALESGKVQKTSYMMEIANALQVSPNWLATGQGEMNTPHLPTNLDTELSAVSEWSDETPLDDDEVAIPFYKEIAFACGNGAFNYEDYGNRKLRMGKYTLKSLGISFNEAFAATARDDSMTPYIQDGDTIFVDRGRTDIKDGRIFAIRFGELHYCKRLYRNPDGSVRIVSDNSDEFPEMTATRADIQAGVFEVIGWVFSVSRLERW